MADFIPLRLLRQLQSFAGLGLVYVSAGVGPNLYLCSPFSINQCAFIFALIMPYGSWGICENILKQCIIEEDKKDSSVFLGGEGMNDLAKPMANPFLMWCFGILGDAFLIVGIVTAVREVTFAGFTPVSWFLLAIICYLIMIWVVTLRILINVESRNEGGRF